MWDESAIARAAEQACRLEVEAEKPGNVTLAHAFPEMTAADFFASAVAIAPVVGRAGGSRVGETILHAVEATRRAAPANTNLGTVLLLAPLARAAALVSRGADGAAERRTREDRRQALRVSLAGVLAGLDVTDADRAFRAIRLARPGGMGRVRKQDVCGSPGVTLLEAMRLAAGRDAVAREYVSVFDLTFGTSLPLLDRAEAGGRDPRAAAVELALELLALGADSLIERKFGSGAAAEATARARAVLEAGPPGSAERAHALARFDAWLREPARRWNPGTTADLVAAALFVWLLSRAAADCEAAGWRGSVGAVPATGR